MGLWNLCDDHGRMEYSEKRIKLQLFPADKIDVAKICGELREKGMICIYQVEGREYLQVSNFRKHQQIKDGDRASKFPEPTSEDLRNSARFSAQKTLEWKGKEGKGKETLLCRAGPDAANLRDQAKEVLEFLNERTGKNFHPVDANLDLIAARLRGGASVQDCKSIIARKRRQWATDEKMQEYLRPATLFNKTKFEQYRGELIEEAPP